MVRILAKIKLYEGENKRKTPVFNGYRPTFEFVKESRTSGQITLINQKQINPGSESIVIIKFINFDYLGNDFSKGTRFYFYESDEPLGEGEVIDLIN